MRTVGVDLAAEPENTGLAILEWSAGEARDPGDPGDSGDPGGAGGCGDAGGAMALEVQVGANDEAVLDAVAGADKAGFDCPLGWPDAFVEFVTAHQRGHVVAPSDLAGRDWRRTLANRRTDLAVRALTGLVPLSVSTDRIGLTAMRAAGLLAALAAHGRPVDRAGGGVVVEVYPAAALRGWGLPHRRYKGPHNAAALDELVDRLLAALPGLRLGSFEPLCRRRDDALDAVVCALVARAAALGRTHPPEPQDAAAAVSEGWIAVPDGPLHELG